MCGCGLVQWTVQWSIMGFTANAPVTNDVLIEVDHRCTLVGSVANRSRKSARPTSRAGVTSPGWCRIDSRRSLRWPRSLHRNCYSNFNCLSCWLFLNVWSFYLPWCININRFEKDYAYQEIIKYTLLFFLCTYLYYHNWSPTRFFRDIIQVLIPMDALITPSGGVLVVVLALLLEWSISSGFALSKKHQYCENKARSIKK
jgi:hypothetical protein